jgi:hypothetical protein
MTIGDEFKFCFTIGWNDAYPLFSTIIFGNPNNCNPEEEIFHFFTVHVFKLQISFWKWVNGD